MKKLAKLFSLLLAMMMILSFAACGNTEEEKTTDPAGDEAQTGGEKKDSIIIATANEPPTLHPYDHNAVAANYMNGLTYNTLMTTNIDTLDPEPQLAESVTALNDNLWEIKLQKGIKFHNGDEMKAEDAVASMEYAKTQYSAQTSIYTNWWTKLEIVDDYTFHIHTEVPCAKATVNLTSIKVVPKKLIDENNDFNTNPVGTGPYVFKNWELGDHLDFEAFADYYEGEAPIKNMTWRIIPEGSSRTIALEAQEIDVIIEVESNDLGRLGETEGITVLNQTGTGHNQLIMNNSAYPFNNQDFRHGVNCAIDKDAVAQVALNGAGQGIWGQTPSVFSGFTEENQDKYDKELAKEYFDKCGMDVSTVVFSCICSDDTKRRAAEVIQANLAEFGITMNLESMDLATYLSATADGNFEAAIGGYTTSTMMSFIEGKYLSDDAGGSNKTFKDEVLDEMYLEAVQILDDAERTAKLEECVARLNEDCPAAPIYLVNQTRAFNSNLEGIKLSANGGLRWQYVSWAE